MYLGLLMKGYIITGWQLKRRCRIGHSANINNKDEPAFQDEWGWHYSAVNPMIAMYQIKYLKIIQTIIHLDNADV